MDDGDRFMNILIVGLGVAFWVAVIAGILWLRRVYSPPRAGKDEDLRAQLLAARADIARQIEVMEGGSRGRAGWDFGRPLDELRQELAALDDSLASLPDETS